MGDCIKQARAFVQDCHEALYRADGSCVQDMTAVLATIQSGAKRNRARAIYRAAQDALHSLEDEACLPHRLHALNNVVSLYETGLVEMEAEESASEDGLLERAPIIPVGFTETVRQSRARDALTSALLFADDIDKPRLETLLKFSDPSFDHQDVIDTEQAALAETDVNSDINPIGTAAVETPPSSTNNAAKGHNLTGIALESFIRDIVQTGLAVARQFKLTLSLSYDMAGVTVPEDQAEELKMKAETCLGTLIQHLAATQETETLSHIDISATASTLKFRTEAAPLTSSGLTSAFAADHITIEHDPISHRMTMTLAFAHKSRRTKAKMPVEEGVSSRLENLLETPLSDDADPFQLGAVL